MSVRLFFAAFCVACGIGNSASAQEAIADNSKNCPVSVPMSMELRRSATQDALNRGVPSSQGGDAESFARTLGFFGNEGLWTTLPPDSRIVFKPGGGGFVDTDGALGIKWAWFRATPGLLAVGGRRLDADAAPARAYIYPYGLSGFQPTYLVFPTPGCWEITAGVSGSRLTFVIEVEQEGDGPDWRMEHVLDVLTEGHYFTMRPDLFDGLGRMDVLPSGDPESLR